MRKLRLAALLLAPLTFACDADEPKTPVTPGAKSSASETPPVPADAGVGEHAGPGDEPGAEGHVHGGGHHRFDDPEKWAKVFDDPARDAWQKPDRVLEWTQTEPGETLVDIGAGTGYFSVLFAAQLGEGKVFANDIEASMVGYLENRAKQDELTNIVAIKGTAESTGLTEPVDVAFMCDVYHHIEDRPAYIASLLTQLKPDGRIIIVDFMPNAPEGSPGPPKAMRLPPVTIDHELRGLGLTMTRMETSILPYQYMLEFKRTDTDAK